MCGSEINKNENELTDTTDEKHLAINIENKQILSI